MRIFLISFAAVMAMLSTVRQADATTVLVYSFETVVPPNGPDGFFGLGATVSQEPTIGVTHGTSSLKYDIGVGGFVGGRTESVVPAELNDPPGVVRVLFDLTITNQYTDTFANLGITVFGHALIAGTFGNQVQFADEVSMAGLAPGTYTDQEILLDFAVGPYRPGESFNDIFGPGALDLTVASAFQFYVNKNVLTPFTFYIDNVRLDDGSDVPEPASLGLFGVGIAMLAIFKRCRARG